MSYPDSLSVYLTMNSLGDCSLFPGRHSLSLPTHGTSDTSFKGYLSEHVSS